MRSAQVRMFQRQLLFLDLDHGAPLKKAPRINPPPHPSLFSSRSAISTLRNDCRQLVFDDLASDPLNPCALPPCVGPPGTMTCERRLFWTDCGGRLQDWGAVLCNRAAILRV